MAQLRKERLELYTYSDYLNWNDNERYELIGGEAFCMSPAPTSSHQSTSGKIFNKLSNFLEGKQCQVFYSPIDVILSEEDVVQPDVIVVCNRDKIKERGIFGAPDVVFEILSPSTATRDKREKWKLYERFGVKEYLIVDPVGKNVEKYVLQNASYLPPEIVAFEEVLKLTTFPELEIGLREIFVDLSAAD